ncbi:PH domain-containing protein, partial [Lactobacillus iners]
MKINHINILPHHVIYQLELYITTCCPEKQSSTNYTVAFTYYNGIIDIKIDWISKYGGNTMKYQTSSKLIIIRAIYSIVMIAILAIIIGSQYLLKLSSEMHNIITYLAIVLIVFLLILMLIYTPLEYKMLGIKINDSGVIIHRGL